MPDLIEKFLSLPAGTDQAALQKELEPIHQELGLEAVMTALYEWGMKVGYTRPEYITDNERHEWFDPKYNITFELQVNIVRSRYKAGTVPQVKGPKPKCAICQENVGLPGKEQLRIFQYPIDRKKRHYFLQVSPFPLYRNHYVLINLEHIPQSIDPLTLDDLFNFLQDAPSYTACSNSDVEWAGASILSHLHYQVFEKLHLPILDAAPFKGLERSFPECTAEVLNYPCPVIKVSGAESAVKEAGTRVIMTWKKADSGRNTVNVVLIKREQEYQLFIILRNPDHRTPPELQEIKSEGIGVIEMAGAAILPVPAGPRAERIWDQIRNQGLDIIKGIIKGNGPLPEERYGQLRDFLRHV
jgi:UDPglucose--hexose-1-phosphate uridylyltransferase